MFDPTTMKAIDDRVGGFEDQLGAAEPERPIEFGAEVLWTQWTQLTYGLQELGVAPKQLCSQSEQIAAVREEIKARAEDTVRR